MTVVHYVSTIGDARNEGQHASLRTEVGNHDWREALELSNETDESKKRWEAGGLFIPAGLFIGMGVGWALGYLVQGLLIGLGVGFLGLAIARLMPEKK